MKAMTCPLVVGLGVLLLTATSPGQQGDFSKDYRITPERLGLPKGNTRTSEPFVTRIYKTDDSDDILKKQPEGYPFTISSDYTLGEKTRPPAFMKGVDLSSRPGARASRRSRLTSRRASTASS